MAGTTKRKASGRFSLNGGVDEYRDPWDIGDNRLQSAADCFIDGYTNKLRPGKRLFGPTFTDKFDGVHEYIDSTGTSRLLVKSGDTVYKVTASDKTAIDTGLSVEETHFHTHRGKCYYNGATTQRKIIGDTASRIGVVAPITAMMSVVSVGSITATYTYCYTYVIEENGIKLYESNPSPALTLELTSNSVKLAPYASSDSRVNARYLYRTTDAGSTLQYLGRIANNLQSDVSYAPIAEAEFNDTVADSALGALLETDHDVPVSCTITEGANETMFGIFGNRLTHSLPAHTESYLEYQDADDYFHVLPHGSTGTGLKKVYNSATAREDLYVFEANATHVLPGGDKNTPLITLSKIIGCVQHDTIAEYNGAIIFIDKSGTVQYLQGGRFIDISGKNIPVSMRKTITRERCRGAIIFKNYYVLTCQDDPTKIYNNTTWVCDLRTISEIAPGHFIATWFKWNIDAEYLIERSDGIVLAFDNKEKRIWELSHDYKEDETTAGGTYTAIPWTVRTKDFNFGGFARFRPHVLFINGPQSKPITITVKYGDTYQKNKATTAQQTVQTPFVAGRSKMGAPVSIIPQTMQIPLPVDVSGVWCAFEFSKSAIDREFQIDSIQYSYTAYERV